MGVNTQRYIRKPLYVDAVRVTAQNFDEIVTWCQGEIQADEQPGSGTTKKYIKVRVHNPKNPRQTKAFIGDWLLYTERGYKVYTNKAFRAAFDLVEERPATAEEIREKLPQAQDKRTLYKSLAEEIPEETELHQSTKPTPVTDAVNAQPSVQEGRVDPDVVVEEVSNGVAVESSATSPPVQPPEVAAAGKRVLSLEEQRQMGSDAVRELITAGEAVLAQDLAKAS